MSTVAPQSKIASIVLAVTSLFLLPSLSQAQSAQVYEGGTGQWDAGSTSDWDGGADTWTNGNNAYFQAPTNTITVSGTVVSNYMEFDSSTTSTSISGGTIDQLPVTAYDPTLIQDYANGAVSVTSQIELSDMGGDEQTFINNSSNYNLELGNIDFGAYTVNPALNNNTTPGINTNRRVNIYSSGPGGSVTLNGAYTVSAAYGYGQINLQGNGSATAAGASVFNISSNANFSGFTGGQLNNYGGGIINLNNDTIQAGTSLSATDADAFNEINIIGGHTIVAGLYDSTKNSGTNDGNGVSTYGVEHLHQGTAALTTWNGTIIMDGSNLNLSSVSGGRLVINSLVGNTPTGMVVSGDGVVVLGNSTGNNYDGEDGNGYMINANPVAADLQSGTTLVNNSGGGSAFGSLTTTGRDPSNPNNQITSNPSIVKIEGGATLGGNGFVLQQIVAAAPTVSGGPTAVLAPGDAGQANLGIAPSIATLTLSGGVVANGGLTMDFKLSGGGTTYGVDSDYLTMSSFTLSGPLTVNLSSIGSLPLMTGTGNEYILFTDNNGDAIDTSDITVIVPTGYALDSTYGLSDGTSDGKSLGYDYEGGTFTVQLVAIPEPSTYALMGLGLVALMALGRYRRMTA